MLPSPYSGYPGTYETSSYIRNYYRKLVPVNFTSKRVQLFRRHKSKADRLRRPLPRSECKVSCLNIESQVDIIQYNLPQHNFTPVMSEPLTDRDCWDMLYGIEGRQEQNTAIWTGRQRPTKRCIPSTPFPNFLQYQLCKQRD